MHLSRAMFAAFLILFSILLLHGQSIAPGEISIASQPYVPDQPGAIHVRSTVVDVNVVARDAKGQPITGLKKEDFEIYDQGKKQNITSFSVEVARPLPVLATVPAPEKLETSPAPPPLVPPRYLGMYFDDENMSTADLVFVRKAAEGFIRKHMEDTDRAGVFTSSTTVTQQFTSNKQEILDTLAKLVSHQRNATFGPAACPKITPYEAFQISQHFDMHTDVFDMALQQAVQCHCSPPDPATQASCIVQQAGLVQTQAATVLSLAEQFAVDSLSVLGDVIRYMGKMPGRRMLIMASSGFFSRTDKAQHAQDKMIDSALRAGIVINTLDAKGLAADWLGGNPADGPPNLITNAVGAPGTVMSTSGSAAAMNGLQYQIISEERSVSSDAMAILASATGGKFFQNSNDLDGGLAQMAALPEVTYALGFSPDDARENGAYHNLRVRIPGRQGITISARPGYFAQTHEKGSPLAKFEKLNKEVAASDTLKDVAADIATQSATLATGESALKVLVHVNGRSLSFKKENSAHAERLIFVTVLFDMQGRYLAGVETVMDMTLKDATLARISKDGVDAQSTLQAPSGSYRLRQVVQEVVGGRLSASTQTVEIH